MTTDIVIETTRGNAVESRPVKTGFLDGNNIEITEGLSVGERVISKGALFIDGMTDQPG